MTPVDYYHRGFDRGNYGSAYESENWDTWKDQRANKMPNLRGLNAEYYEAGLMLGFFSSFELHEIGDEFVREQVAALREKHGEEQ